MTEYYGLREKELNDDRLGRALERLNQQRVTVQAGLVANAVKKFKLDVRQIHYDISNVELFGDHQRQLEKAAAKGDFAQPDHPVRQANRVWETTAQTAGSRAGTWSRPNIAELPWHFLSSLPSAPIQS